MEAFGQVTTAALAVDTSRKVTSLFQSDSGPARLRGRSCMWSQVTSACRREHVTLRGCSSAGRARRSQRRGQGFDPPQLHDGFRYVASIATRGFCPPLFGRTQSSNDSARGKFYSAGVTLASEERRDPTDRGVLILAPQPSGRQHAARIIAQCHEHVV